MSGMSLCALVIEYRSPRLTVSCVHALLSHGLEHVHVVDNSDDEGETSRVLSQVFEDDPRVVMHDAGANLGFAAGVNLGLRKIGADRVLLINNDAVPDERAVSSLRAALDEDGSVCIAYPSLMHAGCALRRIFYHRWLAVLSGIHWKGSFEVPRGCCMLVALDRLPPGPLFDERFFMYGEEIELGWRLQQMGLRMRHVEHAWVQHIGSATSVRGSAFYEERTALAHLLLGAVLKKGSAADGPLLVVRCAMIFMRAVSRCMAQRSLLPMRSLAKAKRLLSTQEVAGSPPHRLRK